MQSSISFVPLYCFGSTQWSSVARPEAVITHATVQQNDQIGFQHHLGYSHIHMY